MAPLRGANGLSPGRRTLQVLCPSNVRLPAHPKIVSLPAQGQGCSEYIHGVLIAAFSEVDCTAQWPVFAVCFPDSFTHTVFRTSLKTLWCQAFRLAREGARRLWKRLLVARVEVVLHVGCACSLLELCPSCAVSPQMRAPPLRLLGYACKPLDGDIRTDVHRKLDVCPVHPALLVVGGGVAGRQFRSLSR